MTTNTKTWSKPTIKKVTGQRGLHPNWESVLLRIGIQTGGFLTTLE